MKPKTIVVVGAGPKAAAIAARVAVMRALGIKGTPKIVVIEKGWIGQAWTAFGGFSDGTSTLCNPAEMDVGFPYVAEPYDETFAAADPVRKQCRRIALKLQQDYSWQRFLLEGTPPGAAAPDPDAGDSTQLVDYILRGRQFPRHSQWARYLGWVLRKSKATVLEQCEVRKAWPAPPRGDGRVGWTIEYTDQETTCRMEADAVVLTGPGAPITARFIDDSLTPPRLLDGSNFWDHVHTFRDIREDLRQQQRQPGRGGVDPEITISVIGAGGAAATILDWLHTTFSGTRVRLIHISLQGAFFPRGDGFAERHWVADPGKWTSLPRSVRRDIANRTDSGVISPGLKASIDRLDRVIPEIGRVARIERQVSLRSPPPDGLAIWLEDDRQDGARDDWADWNDTDQPSLTELLRDDPRQRVLLDWARQAHVNPVAIPSDYVIQAIGFDPWSLLKIVFDSGGQTRHTLAPFLSLPRNDFLRRVQADARRHHEDGFSNRFEPPDLPGLHVPGLGAMQGPGFPSLGSLGVVAARIVDGHTLCDENATATIPVY